MNPLLILILLFSIKDGRLGKSNSSYIWQPPVLPKLSLPTLGYGDAAYFDTFRMELLLDRMRNLTDALDKLNRLRQYETAAYDPEGTMERLGTSLEVAKTFLADTKAERQIDQISGMVEAIRSLGNPSDWMAAMGPLLGTMGKDDGI